VDVVANNWNFRIRFAYVSYRERLRIQSGGLLSAQLEHFEEEKNTSRIQHTGVILARLNGEEKFQVQVFQVELTLNLLGCGNFKCMNMWLDFMICTY
jgi:hypothetical protein